MGEMVPVLIVAIVMIAVVLKSRYRYLDKQQGLVSREDGAENARLRHEVDQLKDRIKVLERIAVEKEDTLTRQIEELRDR
nr:hypothetical protein [uncultured Sphingomonas sp.]